ncbi:uncharacterized protein LOC123563372 isoform X4 [Mercenaria mercenaria]|uniref:uncharacterized protein LOC123563372 isoform X4 n=1 Tax=Mercenaria mercenaria TaxID=6596 RepID=UPI00234F1B5A|nr:uncharacterized protein LOC123563372 isoform X4 [Mercenaria mercenaria]
MAHEKQLRNPKYRSWVKSGLGLKYLKEGLEQFTVDVLDEQHLAILMTVRKASKSMATSCNQCQVNSLLPNHARTRSNHCPLGVNDCNCRQPKGKRTCPNDICGAIYEEVIHLHGSTPPAPYWRNTDATLWCSNPWEIGKCFINAPGYAHTRSASETDCAGLLHIIVNNKGFHSHLQCDINGSDILCKTRQYRNEILHSASMELENETAGNYIDDMIAVLQDAKELCSRAESVEAVKKLTELKTKDFIVSTENEMEIFQEMRKALAKETDESLEKIESTTTGRVSTIQEKFRDVDDAIQRTKAQTLDEIQASHHDLLNKHTLSLDVKATECLENIESSVRIQENRIIQSMKTAESDLTISKVEAIKEMKNIQSDLLNKHMEELGKKVEEINQTLSQKQLSIVKSLEQTGTKQKQMLKSMSKDVNSSEQKEIVVSTPQYITQRMYVDEADGSTEQKQPDYEMMKEVFKKRLISLYMETVVKVSALPLHLERNDATINDLYVTPWLKLDNNSCNVFKTKTSPEVAPGNERTYIDVTVDTEESSKTSNIGAFVGVGVMAVAVTLLAVGIFVLIKRFTKQRKHTQEQPEMIYVQNASERRTYDQLSPPDFEMTANVTVSVYEQLHERNQDTTDYAEIERNNAKVQDRIQDLNNDSEMRRNYEQLQDRLQDSNTYSEMDRNYEQLQDRFQDSNTYSEMDRNYEQLQDRHRDSNNYSEIDRN